MRNIAILITASLLAAGCATQAPPPVLVEPEIQMPVRQVNGAIYQHGLDVRLYEDRIARRVGDLVTVVFEESTSAQKDANTAVDKSTSIGLDTPTILGRPVTIGGTGVSISAEAEREFSGEASADQSNKLSGILTAQVVGVQPNGNMLIRGQKKLTLNQGDEYVTISGIIRRDDIRPNNTISSTRVANAQIAYTGRGALADANSMGWLARFFYSVIWPF